MAIIPNKQPCTTEEKFEKVILIISKLHNPNDGQFLKDFILELCTRYITLSEDMDKLGLTKAIGSFNKFERSYIEQIVKDLQLQS